MLLKTKILKAVLPPVIFDLLRSVFGRKIPFYKAYQVAVRGKNGVEIGGPSAVFKTILPLYQVANRLDGVNFSNETIWEGALRPGGEYNFYKNKEGVQYVSDAADLSGIESAAYDFLLSSNCLEHVANPLKAVSEWCRVLKPKGVFVLVLPKKESNFDHRRPISTFEHLLEDYTENVGEDDLTHLPEILQLHDLARDPHAGTLEQFKQRSLNNFNNRTLHQHVFDMGLIEEILEFTGFDVLQRHVTQSDFFVLGRKRGDN
ncbi:methyltransferase domain-containing protein [Pseudomonas sp. GV071]|uniref:methyltransferase domain-containing protein n=1 Tax=Pseudomonas sp. GV071 TaxID=2135754 RepID=UPI000D3F2BE5|nr:methyltransferase domain-containing protein [Pseudomonas sp. GV071]PTQ68456.1 methyltransferase family protein [Pseudomonas sp. GV071]